MEKGSTGFRRSRNLRPFEEKGPERTDLVSSISMAGVVQIERYITLKPLGNHESTGTRETGTG
jgi:hypothetical protein